MKIAARDIFKNFSGEVGREIVEENFFFFLIPYYLKIILTNIYTINWGKII